MELRQLKYFERSAELLNFTEAARTLYISQSTLSQQIKQLEQELGVSLFNRVGKHVEITENGMAFLPFARKTLQDVESGKQIIKDIQGLHTGVLKIGVTYSMNFLLKDTLLKFSKKYPDINVEVVFATTEELLEKLNANKLDFILSLQSGYKNTHPDAVTLFRSKLHLVVHKSHPLAGMYGLTLKKLQKTPLILPAKGFFTGKILDAILDQSSVKLSVNIELNDINTLLQLVNTGKWATIVTLASIQDQPELVGIPIIELNRRMFASLIWSPGSYRKKSAVAFAELLLKNNS